MGMQTAEVNHFLLSRRCTYFYRWRVKRERKKKASISIWAKLGWLQKASKKAAFVGGPKLQWSVAFKSQLKPRCSEQEYIWGKATIDFEMSLWKLPITNVCYKNGQDGQEMIWSKFTQQRSSFDACLQYVNKNKRRWAILNIVVIFLLYWSREGRQFVMWEHFVYM